MVTKGTLSLGFPLFEIQPLPEAGSLHHHVLAAEGAFVKLGLKQGGPGCH